MPVRGLETVLRYYAYDTNNKVGKTGDVANHTIRIQRDGNAASTPTNSALEISATLLPGWYSVDLLPSETDCNTLLLGGKSASTGIIIQGSQIDFVDPTTTFNANILSTDPGVVLPCYMGMSNAISGNSFAASALTTLQNNVWNALISGLPFTTANTIGKFLLDNINNLSTANIVAAILAAEIETGFSFSDILKYISAFVAGLTNGGGTDTLVFRDLNDTLDRLKFTLDSNNNRTDVQRVNL